MQCAGVGAALSLSPVLSASFLPCQVFIATDTCRTQPAYGRAMAALLQHLDSFTSAATMAQALLALNGRSYLGIASMQCQEELGRRGGHGALGGQHGAGTDATVAPCHRHIDAHLLGAAAPRAAQYDGAAGGGVPGAEVSPAAAV